MKIFVMLLFTLLITFQKSVLATTCDDMRQDLMAIELKLQNSCSEKLNGVCCSFDDNENKSCHTKKDLEAKYNETLAKLIIAEGLASVGMAAEANHNALNDLDSKTITKAEKYIQAFEENIDKAELLDLAFNSNSDDTNIFSGHTGRTEAKMQKHLEKHCSALTPPQNNSEIFCKKLLEIKKDKIKYKKHIEMLTGFYNADNQTSQDQNDARRNDRYKDYREKLSIRTDSIDGVSPSKFKNKSENYKRIMNLKNELNALKKNDTPSTRKEILKLANLIDDISINYTNDLSSSNENNDAVTKLFKKKFNSPMEKILNKDQASLSRQLDLPSLLLEGGIKDNFITVGNRLNKGINRHTLALENEIEKGINSNPLAIAQCGSNFGIACLKRICNNDVECEAGQENNLKRFYKQVTSLEKHQTAQLNLNKAKSCLENHVNNLEAKETCLKALVTSGDTDLSGLRMELKGIQNRIDEQNKSERFQVLNMQKGMALNALNYNYCRANNNDREIHSIGQTDCGTNSGTVPDYEALNLAVNGKQIAIGLNYKEGQDYIHKNYINDKYKTNIKSYRKEFIENCDKNPRDVAHLCEYYEDNVSWERDVKETQEALANLVEYVDPYDVEEEFDYLSEGSSIFFKNLLYQAPTIANGYGQLSMTRSRTKYQLAAIDHYDNNIYMPWLNNTREYLSKPPAYDMSFTSASNWGIQNTGYDYNSISNFQLSGVSTGTVFNKQVPTNFNFTPIPTTFTGTQNTGTNSTNNVLKFNF